MRRGHGSLYDIAVPGYKANLSDVLASIALVQLDKVERHGEIRRRQVAIYDEGIADLDGVEAVARDARDVHANHLYVVRVTFADRDEVQRALTDENIGTSIHFLPVHRLTAYRDRLAPHQPDAAGDRARRRRGAVAAALARALRRRHPRCGRGAAPRARAPLLMKRSLRVAATLVVTALAVAYILLKIDLGKTAAHPRLGERAVAGRVGVL